MIEEEETSLIDVPPRYAIIWLNPLFAPHSEQLKREINKPKVRFVIENFSGRKIRVDFRNPRSPLIEYFVTQSDSNRNSTSLLFVDRKGENHDLLENWEIEKNVLNLIKHPSQEKKRGQPQ